MSACVDQVCRCPWLVLVTISLFAVARIEPNLLVVFLEGSHVLTSLGEFAFLHTLTDVPVDKSALGVHQIELVIQPTISVSEIRLVRYKYHLPSPSLSDSSGVREHADSALDLGEVATRDHSRWLVVDADLGRIRQDRQGEE